MWILIPNLILITTLVTSGGFALHASLMKVYREAAEQGRPLADRLRHLIVHGTLHLLGWDHTKEPEAAAMELLETQILAKLGVSDPYCDTI